jgi:hypothetical protein
MNAYERYLWDLQGFITVPNTLAPNSAPFE